MSMYWAAYHGQGLALSAQEFNIFLTNYKKKCRDKELLEAIAEAEDGDMDISEVKFVDPSDETFGIFCVDDSCEGFRLTPYRIGGRPNEDWDDNEAFGTNGVYVLEADRAIDGMHCFEEKAYSSYSEFAGEFMSKIGNCMPEDFDWDSHIGIYSYACFA